MYQQISFLPFILDLFDGAAAGGEGGAAAPAGNGEGSVPAGAPALKRRSGGAFENVVYGRPPETGPADAGQESASTVQTTSDTAEARKAQYRQFKEGDFKDLFDADINRIVGKKVRENKTLQEQLDAQKPVLDVLLQRYQVADGDYKALMEKVENDNAYWSEAADEAGMTVEQYKQMQKLERENRALLQAQREKEGQERANSTFQRWVGEAQQLAQVYPDFNLETEAQNPQFVSLLRSGVPMEHAYKVIHMDELMNSAVLTTAASTEQKITANVRAKGARPAEAANTPKGAVTYRNDPSKFTKADRAEIARRSLRGEKVSF
jgi:hypothetical protein